MTICGRSGRRKFGQSMLGSLFLEALLFADSLDRAPIGPVRKVVSFPVVTERNAPAFRYVPSVFALCRTAELRRDVPDTL